VTEELHFEKEGDTPVRIILYGGTDRMTVALEDGSVIIHKKIISRKPGILERFRGTQWISCGMYPVKILTILFHEPTEDWYRFRIGRAVNLFSLYARSIAEENAITHMKIRECRRTEEQKLAEITTFISSLKEKHDKEK